MAAASRRPHAWEEYGPLDEGYQDRANRPWDDSGSEDGEPSPEEAGEELAALLIKLRLQGSLSAKQACVLAYWAAAAGAVGPCKEFGCKPDLQTGQFQRRLDKYLAVSEDDKSFYMVDVPGHDKAEASRTCHRLETVPPHEALAAEVAETPGVLQQAAATQAEWSQTYRDHPVVLAAPEGAPVLPLALYIDGVPYSKRDGFLGFWVYNLITCKRHLVAILRKSQMCVCGCRRWCSLWPIFGFLHWSFAALAAGAFPAARHDGEPWTAADSDRSRQAGRPLVRGAVVLIKGDWSEFCLTLGFPTWQTNEHPCLFCSSTKDGLYNVANFSPVSFPFPLKTHAGYEEACAAAEVRVVLHAGTHAAVAAALRYDKRTRDGSHGRALLRDFAALGLQRGDRLEPVGNVPDVAKFEGIMAFPAEVVFWRPSAQRWATHRNPLFDDALGLTLDVIGIDTLHTLNLGLYQKLAAKVFWTLILRDAWGVAPAAGGRVNQEELIANGCLRLRHDLNTWYAQWEAAHPGVLLNKIDDFVPKLLGDRDEIRLKTKAAETRPLVHFSVWLTEHFSAKLADAPFLRPAAQELARFSDLLRSAPRRTPPAAVQALHDSLKRYIILAKRAEVPEIPKLHLAMHLVHRTTRSTGSGFCFLFCFALPSATINKKHLRKHFRSNIGNPLCVRTSAQGAPGDAATFVDESANGRAADLARGLHRATWTRRFFQFWKRLGGGKRPHGD